MQKSENQVLWHYLCWQWHHQVVQPHLLRCLLLMWVLLPVLCLSSLASGALSVLCDVTPLLLADWWNLEGWCHLPMITRHIKNQKLFCIANSQNVYSSLSTEKQEMDTALTGKWPQSPTTHLVSRSNDGLLRTFLGVSLVSIDSVLVSIDSGCDF